MDRRGVFRGAMLAGVAWLASLRTARAEQGVSKVVYHLDDLDKVDPVLGNIRHHYEGVGGSDKVTIALVVHGPALGAFAPQGSAASKDRLGQLQRRGLTAHACVNTLRGMNLELKDLAPGFVLAEKGGVVCLAELQGQGWVYLRP
jgi:uncharacterized protein